MTGVSSSAALLDSLNEALAQLLNYNPGPYDPVSGTEPLESLVSQCAALAQNALPPPPIRTIHHFACTGGTLISKLIAAMPNTVMLSEIDPLSNLMIGEGRNPFFAPTDLIYGARVALRSISDQLAAQMFQASLSVLHNHLREAGQHLVIRDHSHSHFCTEINALSRPSLRSLVQEVAPIRSVITVRHPLDSFLSLDRNGWRHFSPFTLDEYARRYRAFLQAHGDVMIVHYEDLVESPEEQLERICLELDLPFAPGSESLLPVVSMSGDSGRKSATIGRRARHALPERIEAELKLSESFCKLCEFLDYEC